MWLPTVGNIEALHAGVFLLYHTGSAGTLCELRLVAQVEEVNCSNNGPKHLVFMGSNAYTAKSNAGGDAGSRDVFRQSHLKEAEHMGSFSSASVGQRTLKTMANLTQVGRATLQIIGVHSLICVIILEIFCHCVGQPQCFCNV